MIKDYRWVNQCTSNWKTRYFAFTPACPSIFPTRLFPTCCHSFSQWGRPWSGRRVFRGQTSSPLGTWWGLGCVGGSWVHQDNGVEVLIRGPSPRVCVALEDLMCVEKVRLCGQWGWARWFWPSIDRRSKDSLFGWGDVRYSGPTIDHSSVLLPPGGCGCRAACEVEMGVGCCWGTKTRWSIGWGSGVDQEQ